MSQGNSNVHTRLAIPTAEYRKDPHEAVRSLLGNDVKIIDIYVNPIVDTRGRLLVDVEYSIIDFSPFSIFYISSLKKLNNASDIHVADLTNAVCATNHENLPQEKVLCNLKPSEVDLVAKYIPIHVYASIPQRDGDNRFSYSGFVVRNPLHAYATILSQQETSYHGFNVENVRKLYDHDDKNIHESDTGININGNQIKYITIDDELKIYKKLSTFYINNYQSSLYNIKFLTDQHGDVQFVDALPKDYLDTKIMYVLHIRTLRKLIGCYGVIVADSNRNPNHILFIPNRFMALTEKLIESVIKFVENDKINFINFHYMASLK